VTGLATAWAELGVPLQRCLELAHRTLRAGGLACGSVLTDAAGVVVAEGRNRAYDPPGGDGALQGNPLAHAELNALAEIPTGRDLGDCVLWSSQQPCSMCRAAAEFVGVGGVRYLAVRLVEDQALAHDDLPTALSPRWPEFVVAAERRGRRLG